MYERAQTMPYGVVVSALTGDGLDELRETLLDALPSSLNGGCFAFRTAPRAWLSALKEHGHIVELQYGDDAIVVEAKVDPKLAGRLQQFVVGGEGQ